MKDIPKVHFTFIDKSVAFSEPKH